MPTHRPSTINLRTALFDDAVAIVEAEYATDLALDDIARRVASSRRQLQRAYAEIGDMVRRLAAGLARQGFKRGDRVGLFLPNCPFYIVAYFALLKTGATVVNFNPLYTEEEITHQAKDAGIRAMVTLDLAADVAEASGNMVASTTLTRSARITRRTAHPAPARRRASRRNGWMPATGGCWAGSRLAPARPGRWRG